MSLAKPDVSDVIIEEFYYWWDERKACSNLRNKMTAKERSIKYSFYYLNRRDLWSWRGAAPTRGRAVDMAAYFMRNMRLDIPTLPRYLPEKYRVTLPPEEEYYGCWVLVMQTFPALHNPDYEKIVYIENYKDGRYI